MSGENFWTTADERHQEIVRKFYEHVEYEHPKHLSGRSPNGISWCNCSFCATRVKYPTYNGPRVTNL